MRHALPAALARGSARLLGLTLTVLASLAAVVLGLTFGPQHRAGAAAEAGGRCRAAAPTTAAGYQRMFDGLYGRWAGGDQAVSLALPDGRTLWIFADTISGERAPDGGYAAGWTMRHNSFVVQDGGCLTAIAGTPLPDQDAGDWYWPSSAMITDGGLAVFAMRVHRTGTSRASFAVTGTSVAMFALPSNGVPVLHRAVALSAGDTAWGAGVLRSGPWAYIYGTQAAPNAFGRRLLVARVASTRIDDPAAWRYFDGTGFSADPLAASAVVQAPGGVSASVSVLPGPAGGVRIISKRDEVFGRDVTEWSAPTPYGPITVDDADLLTAPSLARPGELIYTAEAHPSLRLADGSLLLSVCRNNLSLSALAADSQLYRPQFTAVRTPQ